MGGYVDRCMGLMSVEQDGMGLSVERSGAEEYVACQTTGTPSTQCTHPTWTCTHSLAWLHQSGSSSSGKSQKRCDQCYVYKTNE